MVRSTSSTAIATVIPMSTSDSPGTVSAIINPSMWAEIYADLLQKMPPSAADEVLGLKSGTVAAAIRRNEIKPYKFSQSRVYVTPCMLAEWAVTYCRCEQPDALPS